MASRLTPCPSCTRHVKVGSGACPFCGGDVPADVPVRVFPAGRPLTRALLVFGAATAVSACSSSTTTPTPAKDAAVDTGGAQPLYGVATMVDSGTVAHYGGFVGPDDGAVMALYGVMAGDGGEVEPVEGGGAPLYGAHATPDGGTN